MPPVCIHTGMSCTRSHTHTHTLACSQPWTHAPSLPTACQKGAAQPHGAYTSAGTPHPGQPPVTPAGPLTELGHLRPPRRQCFPSGHPRGSRRHCQAQLQGPGGGLTAERYWFPRSPRAVPCLPAEASHPDSPSGVGPLSGLILWSRWAGLCVLTGPGDKPPPPSPCPEALTELRDRADTSPSLPRPSASLSPHSTALPPLPSYHLPPSLFYLPPSSPSLPVFPIWAQHPPARATATHPGAVPTQELSHEQEGQGPATGEGAQAP